MNLKKDYMHPFANLEPGVYKYSRPNVPVMEVTVTENAGQLYMYFPYNTTKYKISQLPFDAKLTQMN